jgi:hypothetical protein
MQIESRSVHSGSSGFTLQGLKEDADLLQGMTGRKPNCNAKCDGEAGLVIPCIMIHG